MMGGGGVLERKGEVISSDYCNSFVVVVRVGGGWGGHAHT